MQVWVDADGCPLVVKEILYRAAERVCVQTTLVANRPLRTPESPYINTVRVAAGFDVADGRILELVRAGDLVVTADIPLAAEVVAKGALALSPRGDLYTEENIQERLAVRNLLDELRNAGVQTGGPSSFNKSDRQAFANQLDSLLTRHHRDSVS
jgi:uncharacterized protein YaiI (UPF0178 family)